MVQKKSTQSSIAMRVIKAALIASALSVLLIALYALALKQQWLGVDSVNIVNTAIKVVCAALSGFIAARKAQKRLWLTGAAAGLAYALLAFMVFCVLSDSFEISLSLLTDIGIGVLSGAVAAIAGALKSK